MMEARLRPESRLRAPTAWLAAAIGGLFLPVVLGGESFFGRDVTPFFYPMKHYLAEAIASGRFPLWNPLVAGGEPFFATLQPGVLYPGSLLLYVLPFPKSVDWLIILHFVLAGVGWVVLLQRMGRSPTASLLGALAFVLGGFFVSIGNFTNNLQTLTWAPWLFLAWHAVPGHPSARRFVTFSVVCVVAFLGGEPQLLALVLAVVFLHGILGLSATEASRFRQVVVFGGAGVLALLLAGVQLVPFVEFLGQSVRTTSLDLSFAAARSQEPSGLVHLLVPPAIGAGEYQFTTRYLASREVPWLLSLYPGIIVAGFVWMGVVEATRTERRLWGGLAVFGLLMALGAHTPAYRIAFEALPPLRAFRYPEKFALLFAIGIPFLASAGLDRLRSTRNADLTLARWLGGAGVAYLLLAALLAGRPELLGSFCGGAAGDALLCGDVPAAAGLYRLSAIRLASICVAAVLVLVLARRGVVRRPAACWIVVGLAALDLVTAHARVNPSVDTEIYSQPPWLATTLAAETPMGDSYRYRGTPVSAAMGETVRVRGARDFSNMYLDIQALGPNSGQLFGFAQQDGLQGVEMRSVAMTHDAALNGWAADPVRFLAAMNVRYYVDATSEADAMVGLVERARHPDLPIRLFEVPGALPRAFVANGWALAAGPAEALRIAIDSAVPVRRVALEEAPVAAPERPDGPQGRIVAATWEPERIRLIARVAQPSVLVLLDRWYPGWRVTVNGEPGLVRRANGVFRAVEIPAGEADVEFTFAPASLRVGVGMTGAGIAAALGLSWWSRRRRPV